MNLLFIKKVLMIKGFVCYKGPCQITHCQYISCGWIKQAVTNLFCRVIGFHTILFAGNVSPGLTDEVTILAT